MKIWFSKYKKLLLISTATGLMIWFWFCVPRPLFPADYSTVLESRDGELLGARISSDGQWRFPPPDSIPYRFSKSIVLFEDAWFYQHPGINPFSLARALVQNLKAGKVVSGGSTLTMQVARLARPGKKRSLQQKLVEMIWSANLEIRYSKREILRYYVTQAPFGGNVVGLEAASWRYYNRSPGQLSWAESATLAVLPNAPTLIYPGRNDSLLLKKRNRLLEKLFRKGVMDSLTYALSLTEALPGRVYPLPAESYHLLEHAVKNERGKRTVSTINLSLQREVNQAVLRWVPQLSAIRVHNAAVLVGDIRRGEVLAYAGNIPQSADSLHGARVDIIRSPRSSGSILKPFLFAALLDKGLITPCQLVADIPTRFADFTPENFSHEYDGAVPAGEALARSLNVPAVKMLQLYVVEPFYHFLKNAGMTTLVFPAEHYGLSLILGGAETTLWDLGGMYRSMAAILRQYEEEDGLYSLKPFRPLVWKAGKQAEDRRETTQPLLKASSVYLTLQSLLEVNRPEEETGWEAFAGSRKIAWKTGTSFGFRDAWAVGISRDYFVAVWAGNADGEGRPGLTGATMAAPLLFDVFASLPGGNWFSEPSDELTPTVLCRESGFLASSCCVAVDTVKIQSGIKSGACPYCRTIHLDKELQQRVSGDCYPVYNMQQKNWFVLPPVMEYFFRRKHPGYFPLPPLRPGCGESGEPMEFIYPRELHRIFIPRPLDGTNGKVVFELTHRNAGTVVYWYMDDRYLGETSAFHRMAIEARPGPHRLTVTDGEGNQLVKRFDIVDR